MHRHIIVTYFFYPTASRSGENSNKLRLSVRPSVRPSHFNTITWTDLFWFEKKNCMWLPTINILDEFLYRNISRAGFGGKIAVFYWKITDFERLSLVYTITWIKLIWFDCFCTWLAFIIILDEFLCGNISKTGLDGNLTFLLKNH